MSGVGQLAAVTGGDARAFVYRGLLGAVAPRWSRAHFAVGPGGVLVSPDRLTTLVFSWPDVEAIEFFRQTTFNSAGRDWQQAVGVVLTAEAGLAQAAMWREDWRSQMPDEVVTFVGPFVDGVLESLVEEPVRPSVQIYRPIFGRAALEEAVATFAPEKPVRNGPPLDTRSRRFALVRRWAVGG